MKKILKILERIMILLVIIITIHLFIAFVYKLEHESVNFNYIWNIRFDNYVLSENSIIPNINMDNETIEFSNILKEGEFIEFIITIKNSGVLDAKLSKIDFAIIDEKKVFTYYLKYENGNDLQINDILPSHSEKKIKIHVKFPKTEPKLYDAAYFNMKLKLQYKAI